MGRHSIKVKMMILFAVIIACLVGMLLVLNTTMSEKFYLQGKQDCMLSMYDNIDDIINSYTEGTITDSQMNDSIEQLATSAAVSTLVVNSDWSTVYANINGVDEMVNRLRMSIFNSDIFNNSGDKEIPTVADNMFSKDNPDKKNAPSVASPSKPDNSSDGTVTDIPSDESANGDTDDSGDTGSSGDISGSADSSYGGDKSGHADMSINMSGSGIKDERDIILATEDYTLQKIYDSRLGDYYYELWGTLSSGDSIMLRMAIQGIKDNVSISNKFITYMGIVMIIVGIGAAYVLASYISRPIKQLSELAGKMSAQDFNARYEGNDKSEIGMLGNSMNDMSHKLEQSISQLKSANLELQRDIDRKIQIDEMRTDFLSNVSHELKTPIALIQGYAEGLKEGISDDPESMDFYCEVIMDEANKMNNMVKKLLTLNQIEFGNEEVVMDRFDIVELVSSIVNTNELRASQNGIKIEFDQRDEHIDVWSDEYKIEEVVTNYISNAINHCDFEKVIKVRVNRMGDNVRVSVYNSGKPIPQEDIDNIWGKFYKVDKARTREYGGNGIGLSIVKAIMDSYEKEYGVKNVDNGVEFWFDLDAKSMV